MTSFGIAIPQAVGPAGFDGAAVAAFLRRAEELGFASAWTQEQIIGTFPDLSPLEVMSYAAACTSTLRLGCAVIVSSLASPLHLALSIATVDQLSGGRVDVGLGTGGGYRQFAAFGVDKASYVARFNEGVALMRRLWTEPRVDFDGRFWQLHDVAMEPKPVQPGGPPIWYGGAHPAVLRRTVAHADGFIGAGSQTTARFAEQVAILRGELDAAGRDPATMRIGKRVYVTVDDDVARGRERTEAELQRVYSYFGLRDVLGVTVIGGPSAVADGLREVIGAGAELVMLNPLYDEAEQMERLVAEVLPQLA